MRGSIRFEGWVERISSDKVEGWAWWPDYPARHVDVELYRNEQLIGRTTAEFFRSDLRREGIGDGDHGFSIVFEKLPDVDPSELTIRVSGSDTTLPVLEVSDVATVEREQPADESSPPAGPDMRAVLAPEFAAMLGRASLEGPVFDISIPDSGPVLWLDQEDWKEQIQRKLDRQLISQFEADLAEHFSAKGYCVVPGAVAKPDCDSAWRAFEKGCMDGSVPAGPKPARFTPSWGRVPNVHFYVAEMAELLHHPNITRIMEVLLGRKCVPYQTIPSFVGSEQPAHSDAIHMCTYPRGFLAAAWIALEDITPGSGPLVYYPESHKLPYALCQQVGIDPAEFRNAGRGVYHEIYEPYIQAQIERHELKAEYFTPAKGDVLIWHHNLIHGGSPVSDRESSRKSLVCHYFAEGVLCYHDLSSSLADTQASPPPAAKRLGQLQAATPSLCEHLITGKPLV